MKSLKAEVCNWVAKQISIKKKSNTLELYNRKDTLRVFEKPVRLPPLLALNCKSKRQNFALRRRSQEGKKKPNPRRETQGTMFQKGSSLENGN